MPIVVDVDGNVAFEQAQRTIVDLIKNQFGLNEQRAMLVEIQNGLGLPLEIWGYWLEEPSGLVSDIANEIPAFVEQNSPSSLFGMGSSGSHARAIGIVTYILDFVKLGLVKSTDHSAAFMLFHCYMANPNSQSNKIDCSIDYFQDDYQEKSVWYPYLHADTAFVASKLKAKIDIFEKNDGQIVFAKTENTPPIIGDTYRIRGSLKDLDTSGKSKDQHARFEIFRDSFRSKNLLNT